MKKWIAEKFMVTNILSERWFVIALKFFGQTIPYKFITVVDEFHEQLIVQETVEVYRVPHLLIHVVSRNYFLVLLTKLNGSVGVAFQVDAVGRFEVEQGKHFAVNLKNQSCLVERETLSSKWFGDAIGANFFNIHDSFN